MYIYIYILNICTYIYIYIYIHIYIYTGKNQLVIKCALSHIYMYTYIHTEYSGKKQIFFENMSTTALINISHLQCFLSNTDMYLYA